MKKSFVLFFCSIMSLFSFANAQNFDFSKEGDELSNKILYDFIKDEMPNDNFEVSSYFYDINNDGNNDIIGIIKSGNFYNIQGYKLVILKNNQIDWNILESNVFFDNSKPVKIENNSITYYKSDFYNNKKATAKIQKNKVSSKNSPLDYAKNRKAKNISKITKFSSGQEKQIIEVSDIPHSEQKNVNIHYENLNTRTKKLLDMK